MVFFTFAQNITTMPELTAVVLDNYAYGDAGDTLTAPGGMPNCTVDFEKQDKDADASAELTIRFHVVRSADDGGNIDAVVSVTIAGEAMLAACDPDGALDLQAVSTAESHSLGVGLP